MIEQSALFWIKKTTEKKIFLPKTIKFNHPLKHSKIATSGTICNTMTRGHEKKLYNF